MISLSQPFQIALAALVGASATFLATARTNAFVDADHGFELELPDLGRGAEPGQLLHFYGPETDGFRPNVYLMTQAFEGSIEEYLQTSLDGFKTSGFELVEHATYEHEGLPALRLEYTATLSNLDLHFFAVAVLRDGQALLATGTSLDADWSDFGDEFADSFETLEFFDPK